MKLLKDIYNFLVSEQKVPAYLKSKRNRPGSLSTAIKKRNPVSFFYNGPRGKVQAGRRIKAELVALGLSKKGNMIVRAWVEPPSRSKTGFQKGNWRTFIVSRMSQIEIFDQETFDVKRPGYKEGDDNSMSVTYVTSDWSTTPPVPADRDPQPEPRPEPQAEPTTQPQEPQPQEPESRDGETQTEPETQDNELPEPRPQNRPSIDPPKIDDEEEDEEENDNEDNNYDGLNENINRIKTLLYN
jgi:hypothetical protein